jgi:hypothetical protein
MEQGKIINCIEVCPNACGCDTIFWKENVHTIEGEIYKV